MMVLVQIQGKKGYNIKWLVLQILIHSISLHVLQATTRKTPYSGGFMEPPHEKT